MAELAELKSQRASTKACITRIKNLLDAKGDSLSPVELECRRGILDSYFKQLLSYQTSIEKLVPDDEGEQKVRGELEELYCAAKTRLLTLAGNKRLSITSESSLSIPALPLSNLPKLKLPSFSGKYADFPNFLSSFTKLVDNNPALATIEKFNHLISCLSGPALRTVQGFEVTESNYMKALNQLKSRYDNKYLTFQEHIIALFSLPQVAKNSPTQLRFLIDTTNAHVSSLLNSGSYEDIANAIIIHLVNSKLDVESQCKWEESLAHAQLPTWKECADVLNKRCQCLEARDAHSNNKTEVISKVRGRKSGYTALTIAKQPCAFCNDKGHTIYNCAKFKELPVNARFEQIKQRSLCVNCLGKGHSVKVCSSKNCRVCSRPHHTLLHRYSSNPGVPDQPKLSLVPTASKSETSSSSPLVSSLLSNHNYEDQALLAVAIVQVKDPMGRWQSARALLDSASQLNFVSESLARTLKLPRTSINLNISGIADVHSKIRWSSRVTIKSRLNDSQFNMPVCILPQITGLQPDRDINIEDWGLPPNIQLADPQFFKPQRVDLLIGVDLFFQLLCVGQIKVRENLPTLQKTVLGWVVAGAYAPSRNFQSCIACTARPEDPLISDEISLGVDELGRLVERFWAMEEVDAASAKLSVEHEYCEKLFNNTTQRLANGRFVVKLPFKENPKEKLGESLEIATRRFNRLEQKLTKDPGLKLGYSQFLQEYLDQGHMEEIGMEHVPKSHYFMPHRCVLRPDSSTTKLRVVFDASCPTYSNLSLNDLLMVGPTIQDDLFSILIRFRAHRYALTADISAMYRQILVFPEDQNYQLILWRETPTNDYKVYRLKTVTYGTASAPFLATRCLQQLSVEFSLTHPQSSSIIARDFYMDDLLTGADSREELYTIRREVDTILKAGQFHLRKWYSNDPRLLAEIPEHEREKLLKLNEYHVIKALGMYWEPSVDRLRFHYKAPTESSLQSRSSSSPVSLSSSLLAAAPSFTPTKITKRTVLSETARLFDPLGLINPVVVKAKIFLQELWLLNLHWDESLPQALMSRWLHFKAQLLQLDLLSIPRPIVTTRRITHISLHGYADASIRAYGGCIYIRTVDEANEITVNLLAAKSRVAPSKTIRSLPCLELCAALLLAKLYVKIKANFPKPLDATYLWTDAQIVLDWLRTHASQWKPFVANRVSEIQRLTEGIQWRHVRSSENPADIISRGASPAELRDSSWFSGPGFLQTPEANWPSNTTKPMNLNDLPERRKTKSILACSIEDSLLQTVYKVSDFSKSCRRYAYVLRFFGNLRAKQRGQPIQTQPLSSLDQALTRIVWLIQQAAFTSELRDLKARKQLPPKSTLNGQAPFLQALHGVTIIRVGGRLNSSDLPPDRKFPILLPPKNIFVESYFRHTHLQNFHAGPSALLAIVRRRFWPMNGRNYARKIVRNCMHCFRYRPQLGKQIMGNLPAGRVNFSLPFTHTGVDFCGPFCTTQRLRGTRTTKSYVSIFICFGTRAVHIEVVSDLTTAAFIAALKRFTARRNLCKYLYCDNATNFVGARKQLAEFREAFLADANQRRIQDWCSCNSIEFRHIPPRAPHFGGLWEAAVKCAKAHLYRTIGDSLLTFEELTTVMAQIEGILNSRSITPLSSDPNDLEPLTPAHFLCQAPLATIPEPPRPLEQITYLRRWQRISCFHQHFWRRWSQEYVQQLQQRAKWRTSKPDIAVGQLVLVHEDDAPPLKWRLGRVTRLFPGPDGHVRVVELRTSNGPIRRALHKVAPLPSEE